MAEQTVQSAPEIHFEVHALYDERWVIDRTSRDEKEALADAQIILRQRRTAGVRVLKEMYNPATDRAAARVLFEHIHPKPERRESIRPVRHRQLERRITHATPEPARRQPKPARPTPKTTFAWKGYLLALTALAIAGGGLAFALP